MLNILYNILTVVNGLSTVQDINPPVKSDTNLAFYTHARALVTLFLAAFFAKK